MKLDTLLHGLNKYEKKLKKLGINPNDVEVIIDTKMEGNVKYRHYKIGPVVPSQFGMNTFISINLDKPI